MEISPDDLYNMIIDPTESTPEEVLELVDTYLCTTIDLLIEAVSKRVSSCADKCKHKKHVFCNKLIKSILDQVEPLRNTEFISPDGKKQLDQMEKHLDQMENKEK